MQESSGQKDGGRERGVGWTRNVFWNVIGMNAPLKRKNEKKNCPKSIVSYIERMDTGNLVNSLVVAG